MQNKDNDKTVIVTIKQLLEFEAAIRLREDARYKMARLVDKIESLKADLARADEFESDAQDAEMAARKVLYEAPLYVPPNVSVL